MVDDICDIAYEINAASWARLKDALAGVDRDERDWRPLPQANTINIIVRHLRIESEWHLAGLEHGAPMPTIAAPVPYAAIDAVPLDFELNVRALEASATAFLQRLGAMPRDILRQRTAAVYGTTGSVTEPHRLAYHQALHMVLHSGQIRTIRNLYRTTRGLPPRFFPENPTFPAKRPNL